MTRLNKVSKQHKSNIGMLRNADILVSMTTLPTNIKTLTKKVNKGGWRMPRLQEAMKDVTSCDKLRGGAHIH